MRVPAAGREARSCWRRSPRTRDEAFARHKLQAGVRPQRARPRAGRAAGRARPAPSAAAHRVLRHLQPPGHRDRRVHGGVRGRPAPAVRLPPLQDPSPARPGRLRAHQEVLPGASAASCRSATRARERASASLPADLVVIDGGKGQLGAPPRPRRARASTISRWPAWPSARGGVPARAAEPVRMPPTPRRCTCCSGSATRPTASRSRTTGSCATRR